MNKYKVTLSFYGSASYEIEADSPEEALDKAQDVASLADGEAYDWIEDQGEVYDLDKKESKTLKEILSKKEETDE